MHVNSSLALLRKVITQQGICWVGVTGTSMLPTIPPGAQVAIMDKPFENLELGEIIAFQVDKELFVHRVIQHQGYALITCGDNKSLLDPPLMRDNYIGTVTHVRVDGQTKVATVNQQRILRQRPLLHKIHLWILAPPSQQQPLAPLVAQAEAWGGKVEVIPQSGTKISPSTLNFLRTHLPGNALKIGVSNSAVTSIDEIYDQVVDAPAVHCLIGGSFGYVEQEGMSLLPIDLVDMHVRAGEAYAAEELSVTAAFVLGMLTAYSVSHRKE